MSMCDLAPQWTKSDRPQILDTLRQSDGLPSLGLLSPVVNDWAGGLQMGGFEQDDHERHIILADQLGYNAVWLRDIPTVQPSFGDIGQVHDVWTFAGRLSALTTRIAIGTAAVAIPLDNVLHILRRAASVDRLTDGRFVLGVARGDRPEEVPLFDVSEDPAVTLRRLSELREQPGVIAPRPAQAGGIAMIAAGQFGLSVPSLRRLCDGIFLFPSHTMCKRVADIRRLWPEALIAAVCRYVPTDDQNAPLRFCNGVQYGGVNALQSSLHDLAAAGLDHLALNLRHVPGKLDRVLERIAKTRPGAA